MANLQEYEEYVHRVGQYFRPMNAWKRTKTFLSPQICGQCWLSSEMYCSFTIFSPQKSGPAYVGYRLYEPVFL